MITAWLRYARDGSRARALKTRYTAGERRVFRDGKKVTRTREREAQSCCRQKETTCASRRGLTVNTAIRAVSMSRAHGSRLLSTIPNEHRAEPGAKRDRQKRTCPFGCSRGQIAGTNRLRSRNTSLVLAPTRCGRKFTPGALSPPDPRTGACARLYHRPCRAWLVSCRVVVVVFTQASTRQASTGFRFKPRAHPGLFVA